MREKRAPWLNVGAAFLLLALVLFLGWKYVSYNSVPIDLPQHLLIAKKMLAGWMPYKDIIENKPPGAYISLIPAVLIAGKSLQLLAAMGLLLVAANSFLVYLIGSRLRDSRTGLVAGAIFVMLSIADAFTGFALLTEPISNFFVLLMANALLAARNGPLFFAAGVFAACAISVKQTSALALPLACMLLPWKKQMWRNLGAFAAGFFVVVLLIVAYLAIGGALWDSLWCTVLFALQYNSGSADRTLFVLSGTVILIAPAVFFAALGAFALRGRKELALAAWALLSLIAVCASYSFMHQYVFLFPPMALLAAFGLEGTVKWLRHAVSGNVGRAVSASLYLFVLLLVLCFCWSPFTIPDETAYAEDALGAAAYLNANMALEDKVFAFPKDVIVYYLTDKDPFTRGTFFSDRWVIEAPMDELEAQVLEPLRSTSPRYVVIVTEHDSIEVLASKNYLAVMAYVDGNYHLEKKIGGFNIYEKNEEGGNGGAG